MGGPHEDEMKFKYSTKTEQLGIDCFYYTCYGMSFHFSGTNCLIDFCLFLCGDQIRSGAVYFYTLEQNFKAPIQDHQLPTTYQSMNSYPKHNKIFSSQSKSKNTTLERSMDKVIRKTQKKKPTIDQKNLEKKKKKKTLIETLREDVEQ
jgi:hypothetical protein